MSDTPTDPYAGFNSHIARDTTHFQNLTGEVDGRVDHIDDQSPTATILFLQAGLRALGYQLEVDGQWSYETDRALGRFQEDRGQPVQPYASKRMLNKLVSELVNR